jgi:hypothetical protein
MPDLFHTGRAREDSGTYSLGSWQAVGVESTRGGELYEKLYCNDRASISFKHRNILKPPKTGLNISQ